MKTLGYIGFGANLGNPSENFAQTLQELDASDGIRVLSKSDLYETEPVGLVDGGPNFLNAVILVETDLDAGTLISKMRSIEKKLGKSSNHKSDQSRLIDLDLLFFGSEIIDKKDLQVPHPRLHTRAFVLCPMHEIAPDFEHPALKKSIRMLLEDLGTDQAQTVKPVKID